MYNLFFQFKIMYTYSLLLLLICSSWVTGDKCKSMETCSACIRSPNCMWCMKPGNFTSDSESFSRCKEIKGHLDVWRETCGRGNVIELENYFEVYKDLRLAEAGVVAGSHSSFSSSSFGAGYQEEELIQMKPQHVGMSLRIQESQSMSITFRQAEDYPVDLYYLMDLSQSMADDKESLSALGQQLAEEMQNITRNFRLGFGSFVDKVVMPYVSTVPEKLIAPCDGCAPPYGFRNALRLSTDASHFVQEVDKAPVSGNLDAPEGGFDAIMQAIKCKEQIGWRESARHLLLFTTDAGIVKPNDGECHLDNDGYYTYSSILDYPSVSQINQVVKEENINLIFAVTSEQSSVYKKLSYMIEGSSAGELAANSSNIVKLVKDEYNKITSRVELKDNAQAPVSIRYFSRCKSTSGPEIETSVCEGLRVGDEVEFRMEVTVDECPKNRSLWKQQIEISPVALPDKLILDLEMLCNCECEREGDINHIENATECSGKGTYQCGVCACYGKYRGRHCECGPDTPWGDGIISGQFCECTNFLCEHHNGQICSGPDHGSCVCSKCLCKPGWKGDACECKNSTQDCINPDTGEECSNQGFCECNQCKCFDTDGGRYSGKYCEDCPTCKAKCTVFKDCVQCQAFGTGELSPEECEEQCTLFNASKVVVAVVEDPEVENLCSFFDEEDCRFKFVYGYDENKEPFVRVQRTLECPPKLDILGIVLGVIGAIVGVGLLLLVMWKFLTTIHDRREYARFEKERMMAKWDTGENPIYQQATSTFKNPIMVANKILILEHYFFSISVESFKIND
ncbi:Integrin beta-PS [Armadillidium vulgare]|nr:Integrin beta-PS [Armadillidium vulgare]